MTVQRFVYFVVVAVFWSKGLCILCLWWYDSLKGCVFCSCGHGVFKEWCILCPNFFIFLFIYLIFLLWLCKGLCLFLVVAVWLSKFFNFLIYLFNFFVVAVWLSKRLCILWLWPYEFLKGCIFCGCSHMTVKRFFVWLWWNDCLKDVYFVVVNV